MHDSLLSESILDKSATFMCLLDSSGTIVSINSRFAKLMGKQSREALVGQKATESVQGCVELKSFLQTLTASMNDTVFTGSFIQSIHRNAEKPVWVKFDIANVHSSVHGICTLITGADITEEVQVRREAEQIAHERSSFLVRMGHELRTPLNTVLGYAQLINAMDDISPVAKQYAATIISNENTLLHLLNDILELSKYETGQSSVLMTETNVRKLVQEVTQSYIEQFNSKYLSLSVEYKTDIPDAILTDAPKVTQTLSNILGNALKFTRKGGVTVTVSCGQLVTIDVEDTGIGIDPEDSKELFDFFAQTGNAREHMMGIGIGLAIARIFARMLGGDVVLVRSGADKGSLFRFTFEARPVTSMRKKSPTITDYTAIQSLSKPCRVLLVDDVDINLAMLEIFLSPAGFDVSIAANGNEAVEKFKSFKPDIVFMDLIMPEKDGFEATREIKQLNREVPVIALTASIVDSVKEQALEAGVNDFMTKPFMPERLFEIISEHTGTGYVMKEEA